MSIVYKPPPRSPWHFVIAAKDGQRWYLTKTDKDDTLLNHCSWFSKAQGAWAGLICSLFWTRKGRRRKRAEEELNATGPDPLYNTLPPPSNSSVKPTKSNIQCGWTSWDNWICALGWCDWTRSDSRGGQKHKEVSLELAEILGQDPGLP